MGGGVIRWSRIRVDARAAGPSTNVNFGQSNIGISVGLLLKGFLSTCLGGKGLNNVHFVPMT